MTTETKFRVKQTWWFWQAIALTIAVAVEATLVLTRWTAFPQFARLFVLFLVVSAMGIVFKTIRYFKEMADLSAIGELPDRVKVTMESYAVTTWSSAMFAILGALTYVGIRS